MEEYLNQKLTFQGFSWHIIHTHILVSGHAGGQVSWRPHASLFFDCYIINDFVTLPVLRPSAKCIRLSFQSDSVYLRQRRSTGCYESDCANVSLVTSTSANTLTRHLLFDFFSVYLIFAVLADLLIFQGDPGFVSTARYCVVSVYTGRHLRETHTPTVGWWIIPHTKN